MNLTLEQQFRNLIGEFAGGSFPEHESVSEDALRAEFVFDDGMCAIIRPDATAQYVLLEMFALDLSFHTGPALDALMEGIMHCNAIGTLGRPFFAGVDERNFVLIFNRLPLAGLSEARILEELNYLLEQSRAVRSFLELLALGVLPAAGERPAGAGDDARFV